MKSKPLSRFFLVAAFAKVKLLLVDRLLPLALHWRGHRAWLKLLAGDKVSALKALHPMLKHKYLRRRYLFSSLSVTDGLAIIQYHYQTVSGKVASSFFPRLIKEQPQIWETQTDDGHFGIRLTFPYDLKRPERMHDHEGDLMLLFEFDQKPIYIICMTIVPGEVAQRNFNLATAGDVIFVGRVQGVPGKFAEVRTATKALNDITPSRLLINATEAIARIFGAELLVCVSNDEQLSKFQEEEDLEYYFDYDNFWNDLGAHKTSNGFFCIERDAADKPIEEIRQKHRSRTRAKRNFRKSVVDATEQNLRHDVFSGDVPANDAQNETAQQVHVAFVNNRSN